MNSLEKYGRNNSYLFYSFIKWIILDTKRRGINKIYFFTREGEFYKQIADEIKDDSIDTSVLEVSRLATFFPSLEKFNIDNLMRIWSQYSKQSMDALFKSLGLNISDYVDYLKKYNIKKSEIIDCPFKDERVKKLFENSKFVEKVELEKDLKKKEILKYFENKGLNSKKETIAIVDIGWRGTIQDNICYLLPHKHIVGYYFGLSNFLNKQPVNSEKYGFLNMFKRGPKYIECVTPFEMISNSPNGSTIGYKDGKAIRKIDEKENESFYNCSKYIQNGVLNEIKNYTEEVPNYDKAIKQLAKIAYDPNKRLAKTYFKLKHNEEFGVGGFVDKQSKISKFLLLKAFVSRKSREEWRIKLTNTTWPQGYTKYAGLGLINKYYHKKNYKKDDSLVIDNYNYKKKIAWFVPKPLKGSGGHRTIIQNANMLVRNGYKCDIYLEEDYQTTSEEFKKTLIEYYGECLCDVYVGAVPRIKYDLVFATHAVGTPNYCISSGVDNMGYFIQDFEPWFTSMGEDYIEMENSYRYNFKCTSIGNWLSYKIHKEFNRNVQPFPFCADLNIYKPLNKKRENAICFIFQPEKSRRCPNLGMKALKIVKELRPDVKIYLYGSPVDWDGGFEHENLFIIPLDKCNELYNKCKVGLCISASNPSRIPFEMMAAGLPVVDLYRENNLYDMPEDGVLLAESTPEAIATSLIKLLDDEKLNKKMSEFGPKYMKNYPLEMGFELFLKSVDNMFEDEYKNADEIQKIYNKKPLEVSDEVKNISHIIHPMPAFMDTSNRTRFFVKQKKRVKNILKRILGR